MSAVEQLMLNDMFSDYPDVVSPEQLKKMLNISRNSAYKLVSTNMVTSIKIGKYYRIPKISVIAFITNQSRIGSIDFKLWTSREPCDMLCLPTVD